jgi:hypothetical protein
VTARVVLVRRWVDAHGGGGCCGGDVRGGICLEHPVGDDREDQATERSSGQVASAYLLLRQHAPEVDVQVVGADNVAYLLPASFLAARKRMGRLAALRQAVRSTTAGAVLVDGVVVGDVDSLGPQGVLEAVRQAGSGTSSTAATV